MSIELPQTRYVRSSDGASLAVSLIGEERHPPLIVVGPWATAGWSEALGPNMWETLAARRFVIRFDRRGTGASGREAVDLSLDAQLKDLVAVADAFAPNAFDMYGSFDGSCIAIAFAARCPERVEKLILWHPFVDGADWIPASRVQTLIDLAGRDWTLALHSLSMMWAPRGPVEYQRALVKGFRERLTPDVFARSFEAMQATNVAQEAARVQADTLILSPSGAGLSLRHAQEVASLIPHSSMQLVEQQSPTVADERMPRVMLRFLDGDSSEAAPAAQQATATAVILFTDIVSSTELTERMGDARFRDASRALDAGLRAAIREAGGVAIDGKLLGDGVLATFTSAAQAVDGARRCLELSQASELGLHIGLHAGDVIREDNNVYGGAVNIAARICGLSAPGEILVSDVVRGMARSSASVTFEDRGEQEMKGVGEPVRVYAVRWRE